MKIKILFSMLLVANLSFGQATANQSVGSINTTISNPVGAQSNEIFRFRAGNVRQLDAGSAFNFTNSRWFTLGRLNTGSQTVYGLRFQLPNKSLTLGYQDLNDSNPRIQWIGTGSNLGNLEFRVADSFTSTNSILVASMRNSGRTIFGSLPPLGFQEVPKVGIANSDGMGLLIKTAPPLGNLINTGFSIGFKVSQTRDVVNNYGGIIETRSNQQATGLDLNTVGGEGVIGVRSIVSGGIANIGVFGSTSGQGFFGAGIYGETLNNNSNQFAGYFDGDVFTTGSYLPSDAKLKTNVKEENSALEKLSQLRPVSYDYKSMPGINLSTQKQHGFIAQEMAEVYPELTKDVTKPIFDKDGKVSSNMSIKVVNYDGLIPILTAAINEMNDELKVLKAELAHLKSGKINREVNSETQSGLIDETLLEQNVPNPFSDQSTIRYVLPNNTNTASLMIFDLQGNIKKEYPLTELKGEIVVRGFDIGKGMFIYSLVNNGQELISKKMIIK